MSLLAPHPHYHGHHQDGDGQLPPEERRQSSWQPEPPGLQPVSDVMLSLTTCWVSHVDHNMLSLSLLSFLYQSWACPFFDTTKQCERSDELMGNSFSSEALNARDTVTSSTAVIIRRFILGHFPKRSHKLLRPRRSLPSWPPRWGGGTPCDQPSGG